MGEIEEMDASPEGTHNTSERGRHVRTKVPEVEIQLYREGKGPIAVFKSALGGWEQDQLEVRDILDKHGLKCIYAFNPQAGGGRGVPVRFNPRNGRSILTYRDGAVVHLDGEPKGGASFAIGKTPVTGCQKPSVRLMCRLEVLPVLHVPAREDVFLAGKFHSSFSVLCLILRHCSASSLG